MTRAEWDAGMQRWMHRNDIEADLPQIWEFATSQFHQSWLRDDTEGLYPDEDALLAAAPRPLHHAGLMYLHQLAQDDEGLMRETGLFTGAMADFVLHWSMNNFKPDPFLQENA